MKNINQQAKELIREHLTFWELARQNYAALEKVQTRRLEVNGYPVILQFNPERIRSSAAKIDKQSLASRPCFLCEAHRPGNQTGNNSGLNMSRNSLPANPGFD